MKGYLLVFLLLASSCASSYKSKIAGGIAGGLIGSFLGSVIAKDTSPNIQSDNLNQIIGSTVGLAAGSFAGYQLGGALYQDNPENFKGKDIEIQNIKQKVSTQVPLKSPSKLKLSDLKIEFEENDSRAYLDDVTEKLPKRLKDQAMKQVVIEHKIPAQKFQTESGKTIFINETTAIEHIYSE